MYSAYVSNQDMLLDKHKSENSFGEQRRDIGCPVKSLLVYLLHFPLLSQNRHFRFRTQNHHSY